MRAYVRRVRVWVIEFVQWEYLSEKKKETTEKTSEKKPSTIVIGFNRRVFSTAQTARGFVLFFFFFLLSKTCYNVYGLKNTWRVRFGRVRFKIAPTTLA